MTRTQWLDLSSLEMANLIGKNVLIVDEVDDTRTTLEYAVRELQKDVDEATTRLGRETEKTTFTIFVLHVGRVFSWGWWGCAGAVGATEADGLQNKDKQKKGHLPQVLMDEGRYLAAETVDDVWICYPWEATYVLLATESHKRMHILMTLS